MKVVFLNALRRHFFKGVKVCGYFFKLGLFAVVSGLSLFCVEWVMSVL